MRQLRETPCRMLARIVGIHVRAVRYSEKHPMRFAVFWRISVRFSDPPYAPLIIISFRVHPL